MTDRAILRRRRRQHPAVLALAGLGVAILSLTPTERAVPWLVWNASASVPVGLYRVTDAPAERGALVLVRPPDDVVALAAERGYLPAGVPLIKRITAAPGDHVCAVGSAVVLHTQTVVPRRETDAAGRPLPRWSGCRRLADGEVFLLMADAPDSFDSRYFGPVPSASVMGRLVPLWTD
ncbi:conjugative transfer signal peptidase TraF [Roseospira visakhapatnamensis]|uniref:Conjugative transfer signal peptidase TraF n=1 Tax=Roseospira visakhapatnamensis TaxID=390880 RepID=A0A7W6RG02_9PROT|nr:conjugative transfer signal peptidase TraF [Roseospira visakhapatnamensis]MBB4267879.1 conjugative transfer signal peptidase TraF [Roseospira visakhapatnamensis]